MPNQLSVHEDSLGITALWTGGAVAILVDDASGHVLARAAVGFPAKTEDAARVLSTLIQSERERRGRLQTR